MAHSGARHSFLNGYHIGSVGRSEFVEVNVAPSEKGRPMNFRAFFHVRVTSWHLYAMPKLKGHIELTIEDNELFNKSAELRRQVKNKKYPLL